MSWLGAKGRGMFLVNMGLIAWFVIGNIAHIMALSVYRPLTVEVLPIGTIRWLYYGFWSLGVCAPAVFICWSYFATKNKWLAPVGGYTRGVEYKVWTSYRFTAMAMMAAMFAAAGIISPSLFDLCALPAMVSSCLFDCYVGWSALYVGDIVRSVIWFVGDPFAVAWGWGWPDALSGGGVVSAILYKWLGWPGGRLYIKNRVLRLVVFQILYTLQYYSVFHGTQALWIYGSIPAAIAFMMETFVVYTPGFLVSNIVGYLIADSIVERYRQTLAD